MRCGTLGTGETLSHSIILDANTTPRYEAGSSRLPEANASPAAGSWWRPRTEYERTYPLTQVFKLDEHGRNEMLPGGTQRTFDNRVGWARTYPKKAGLLETPGLEESR